MDSLYVKNLDKKDRDHMKKQQTNLKEALAALDIDETKFYEVLKDGPHYQLQIRGVVYFWLHRTATISTGLLC